MPMARSAGVGVSGIGLPRARQMAIAVKPKIAASAAACRPENMRKLSMRSAIMRT